MWTKEVFGTDVYHLVSAFIIYSIMGWLVESIYMSFCNHKLTNRGFARSPFCPIYGFGAVIGYLVLHPLEKDVFGGIITTNPVIIRELSVWRARWRGVFMRS